MNNGTLTTIIGDYSLESEAATLGPHTSSAPFVRMAGNLLCRGLHSSQPAQSSNGLKDCLASTVVRP